jgi:hypothetical protein
MPAQLQDIIRRARSKLDEPAYPTLYGSTLSAGPFPRLYTDTELTDWTNDGLRDLARRAEVLITYDSTIQIPAYGENPGLPIPTYPLSLGSPPNNLGNIPITTYSDIIRINRVEFQITGDSSQTYPLEAATQQYLDNIWNIDQLSTMSYPAYWCTRGYPGGTGRNAYVIQVFPNPGQSGQLNIFYYRLPYRLPSPDVYPSAYELPIDCYEGWDDMIVDYVQMQGLIKQRNPDWQAAQAMYEAKVVAIVNVASRMTDQPQYITYDTMVMPWAYDSWGGF